jgi:ATP-dependent helicase/DNAse subunit B
MSLHLYLAPAAAGKTAFVLDRVREVAQRLQAVPRVVLPGHLQVRAWRRRLAEAGGAIGVRLLTFDRLYAECLNAAGEAYTELSEPVQYRLIRAVVDSLPLVHYAPLVERPGFIHVVQELLGELKAARILPDDMARAVAALGDEARLRELARIYAAYQAQLQAQGWADRAGLAWLAVEALEGRAPEVARDWPLLVVDGFDNFTQVQLALLEVLAGRVGELIITLTGAPHDGGPRPVHRRFDKTRQNLEAALRVTAEPLPASTVHPAPALAYLEANLFRSDAAQVDGTHSVELIEAPDRAAEVRAALRWLKARLVADGMRPGEVALLARSMPAYRPFMLQTAAEFGLPVRLVDGLPLRANPAVAALLDLLRLMLPRAGNDPQPALPRRLVIEAWRSPYFDWRASLWSPGSSETAAPGEGSESGAITPEDAEALDAVARWGRVMGGRSQWEEVLDSLAALSAESPEDEERGVPAGLPVGAAARALRDKFRRFLQQLAPPAGERPMRDWVGWLEARIGDDPAPGSSRFAPPREPGGLRVVARARAAAEAIAERDVAALQALKDILRGLVWAEEALGASPVDFSRFFDELAGAVEAGSCQPPIHAGREEVLVADVVQARGLSLRAVAVLGLAEGEFPASLGEDPFLRDADRARLRERFNLPLEPSTESAEVEFFYETVTRPRERLLLTRPRLADNGAPWQASPFWEEVRRLVWVRPEALTSDSLPTPDRAASWPELVECLAAHPHYVAVQDWARRAEPVRMAALDAAVRLFQARRDGAASSFDGDLSHIAGDFAQRFGPEHRWSGSRLEAYRTCPFSFFIGSALRLEPKAEPSEGLDARQLGSIYHRILERVYLSVADPGDLAQLLAALPEAAGVVLDEAPQREGFRETAWWAQTRAEIVEVVRSSLQALGEIQGEFIPYQYEVPFGLEGRPPLSVSDGPDRFLLRGYIDRVDRTPDGRLRIIDYKTGGPSAYGKNALTEGKKLQLPLYALAARDALGLGEPAEGFYWHIGRAEPSGLSLRNFEGGPEGAMHVAAEKAWEAVRGARAGHFAPRAPEGGCPSYCPAAGFCWHFTPGFSG